MNELTVPCAKPASCSVAASVFLCLFILSICVSCSVHGEGGADTQTEGVFTGTWRCTMADGTEETLLIEHTTDEIKGSAGKSAIVGKTNGRRMEFRILFTDYAYHQGSATLSDDGKMMDVLGRWYLRNQEIGTAKYECER